MIPMDWIDLDIVKATDNRTLGDPSPRPIPRLPGDVLVRVNATALILGQLWKKNFSINYPIFKKPGMRNQNNKPLLGSHQRTEKTKINREKLLFAGLHSL